MSKKILVSGIQSSGKLHIGNYFGAIKQNIELSNSGDYKSYIFVADYHSMTTLTNANDRRENTMDVVCTYIACGLDLSNVTLFKQSDVPTHTELAWILDTVTPMSMLMLAHAYKDKQNIFGLFVNGIKVCTGTLNESGRLMFNLGFDQFTLLQGNHTFQVRDNANNIITSNSFNVSDEKFSLKKIGFDTFNNAGLFTYPVLMAADILMYGADVVPVGRDQEQHLEMTREIAGKFNRAYNTELFTMPQAYIVKEVATVPGIDGTKMSKSKNNHIPLFCEEEDLKKRVMSIVTDSATPEEKKNPDENNIYNIHKLFLTADEDKELRAKFENGGYGYKDAKEDLFATILKWRAGKKEKYDELMSKPETILEILKQGGKKARTRAEQTMKVVRFQVGLQ